MSKLSPLETSERRLGLAMLAPAVILLAGTVLYPIGALVRGSFTENKLTEPWMANSWIGFDNYAKALGDERFWEATWHTLLYVIVTVPGAVILGLGLALLANQPFKAKWPIRLGLLLPWALPLVFAGLIFRWFFEYQQGLVNNLMIWVGLQPVNWLTREGPAFFALPSSGNPQVLQRLFCWLACKPSRNRSTRRRRWMVPVNGGSSSRSRSRCCAPPLWWR
jgi:multiple sugar transport system permease protein